MKVILVKVMLFIIQLIIVICIPFTQASLKVTFSIRDAKHGVYSYFYAARPFTSNVYVGAQCKVRRDLVCEPLTFDWFQTGTYKDDLVYLMKSCVVETFDEKVTFV